LLFILFLFCFLFSSYVFSFHLHVCFKGGSFLENSGSTNDLAGTNLNFDTSQYEEMLKQMFATGSDKDEGSPFDPNSYSGDINKAGTGRPGSAGTNQYHRYNVGTSGNSYGSYSSG
jgi:hypothetical protein